MENNKLDVCVSVSITDRNMTHNRFETREEFRLEGSGFIEVCRILSIFHELKERAENRD